MSSYPSKLDNRKYNVSGYWFCLVVKTWVLYVSIPGKLGQTSGYKKQSCYQKHCRKWKFHSDKKYCEFDLSTEISFALYHKFQYFAILSHMCDDPPQRVQFHVISKKLDHFGKFWKMSLFIKWPCFLKV